MQLMLCTKVKGFQNKQINCIQVYMYDGNLMIRYALSCHLKTIAGHRWFEYQQASGIHTFSGCAARHS